MEFESSLSEISILKLKVWYRKDVAKLILALTCIKRPGVYHPLSKKPSSYYSYWTFNLAK